MNDEFSTPAAFLTVFVAAPVLVGEWFSRLLQRVQHLTFRLLSARERTDMDRCLNCNEPVKQIDCADGNQRWMHIGSTGPDDPYGPRTALYQQCKPTTVATPRLLSANGSQS